MVARLKGIQLVEQIVEGDDSAIWSTLLAAALFRSLF